MSKVPVCRLCRERPAAVPDRNRSPSPRFRREICRECHAERLRLDMLEVADAERRRVKP